jgi:hypothetical protein
MMERFRDGIFRKGDPLGAKKRPPRLSNAVPRGSAEVVPKAPSHPPRIPVEGARIMQVVAPTLKRVMTSTQVVAPRLEQVRTSSQVVAPTPKRVMMSTRFVAPRLERVRTSAQVVALPDEQVRMSSQVVAPSR